MAKFQWLNDESQLQEMVFGELDSRLSDLVAQIRLVDGGFALVRFFKANANTLRTVDDIAFRLHQAAPAVEKGLRAMMKLNLVQRVEAGGVTWFGMTRDPERRRMVHDVCGWQDRWRARLAQIEQVVNGIPSLALEGKVPIASEIRKVAR